MKPATQVAVASLALLLAVSAWLVLVYPSSRRIYLPTPRCVAVDAPHEILAAWRSAGVRGRVSVLFTRTLNGEASFSEVLGPKYLETAIDEGIVRAGYHPIPEPLWRDTAALLARAKGIRPIPQGFADLFGGARIVILPLSTLPRLEERALVVVAPGEWTQEDLAAVKDLLARRLVPADLVAVLRGNEAQVGEICGALLP